MYGADRFKPLKTQNKCNTNRNITSSTIYLYSPTRKLQYNLKLYFSHISHFSNFAPYASLRIKCEVMFAFYFALCTWLDFGLSHFIIAPFVPASLSQRECPGLLSPPPCPGVWKWKYYNQRNKNTNFLR